MLKLQAGLSPGSSQHTCLFQIESNTVIASICDYGQTCFSKAKTCELDEHMRVK